MPVTLLSSIGWGGPGLATTMCLPHIKDAFVESRKRCAMSTIRYLHLPLLGALWLVGLTPAFSAGPSLGEAVMAADAKYLETPEIGAADNSPKIVAGGGEDGLPPLDDEISLGRLRVTLTYVEEEPQPKQAANADELPGEADEAPSNLTQAEDEPLAQGEIPLEAIPADAMLPGEFDIGETVWRTAVVTVYFDDPNPRREASEAGDATSSDLDPPQDAASTEGQPEAGGDIPTAEATEPAGPRVVAELRGPSTGVSDPPVSIQIAELDPGNSYPEVVVSFFTGGAHCCSVTSVVTSNADGSEWTTVDVGEFDGGPMLAVDLDGDGTSEFETRDNAFLSAFGCYACSQAPLQVLALDGAEIKDASADPRFKLAHAAWLKNMIVSVPEPDVNGFLAGYVGQKIRLGEGKQAWGLMLNHYDRNRGWGLEICDGTRDARGECSGNTSKVSFPEALELMLKENGYKIGG